MSIVVDLKFKIGNFGKFAENMRYKTSLWFKFWRLRKNVVDVVRITINTVDVAPTVGIAGGTGDCAMLGSVFGTGMSLGLNWNWLELDWD